MDIPHLLGVVQHQELLLIEEVPIAQTIIVGPIEVPEAPKRIAAALLGAVITEVLAVEVVLQEVAATEVLVALGALIVAPEVLAVVQDHLQVEDHPVEAAAVAEEETKKQLSKPY
ncbi:MAG: hypothetical protein COA50_11955 [Flavobacteriaceae bacterium]|nr:MAG: hypothetical protein COA50_11955 [Flavobacteriaceae bacterium]